MAKDDDLLAINQILAQYTDDVDKVLTDAMESTAKEALAMVKEKSPEDKGKYKKGWKLKKVNGQYVIYNKIYQLTHLLEDGHDIVAWGRKTGHYNGQPHIKPARDWAEEEIVKRIEGEL